MEEGEWLVFLFLVALLLLLFALAGVNEVLQRWS